jgi:hypothetical protein
MAKSDLNTASPEPKLIAANEITATKVTSEQFLAGRDLAVQLMHQVMKVRENDEYSCEAQYREGVPQVTVLSRYLAKLQAQPSLIPGFDSIMTDYIRTGTDAVVYEKLTLVDILGEQTEPTAQLECSPLSEGEEVDSARSGRENLSFTLLPVEPKAHHTNWNVKHEQSHYWSDHREIGRAFVGEIAALAACNEDAAQVQIVASICSPDFQGGWGEEHGFATELSKLALIGLRAMRAGAVDTAFNFEPR